MTFVEFKNKIEKLTALDVDNLRKIQALITYFFKNKPIPYLNCTHEFVVRASKNNSGEVFTNASRCSYNPFPKTIPIQRCNYPGQQIFYCSLYSETENASTSMTCLAETGWEYIEDFKLSTCIFTLSRWTLKRPLKLFVLPFSKISCEKNGDFKRIKENIESDINSKFEDTSDMMESLEYISDVFCKREEKSKYYKISAAFFNSLIFYQTYNKISYDGLLYPSANTEGAGINLALYKELIDQNILKCDVVTMYMMNRDPFNAKHLVALPISNNSLVGTNGNLYFRPQLRRK